MKFSNIAYIALSLFINDVTSRNIQIDQSMISTDGTCGPQNGYKICPDNQCCDKDGKCGFSESICSKGCQEGFGYCLPEKYGRVCPACIECFDCDEDPFYKLICPSTCIVLKGYGPKPYTRPPFDEVTTTVSENEPAPTPEESFYSTCGPEHGGKVCPGNECCGKDGKCGFDTTVCGDDCQEGFGYCLPKNHGIMVCDACVECVDCDENPEMALFCPSTCITFKRPDPKPYTPPPFDEVTTTISENEPAPTPEVSTDGTCGPQNGNKICPGDECCGKDGKCGFNKTVCGDDCQEDFGYCLPKDKGIPVCVACQGCIDCDNDPEQRLLCPSTCKGAEFVPEEGTCGPEHGGKVCPGNQCCGKDGKCGFSKYICGKGCQEGFGYCLPENYNSMICPACYRCFECDAQMKLLCPSTCKN
eukprot:jgi/Orpsp1_1/1192937/evm.model.d7180000097015.1